MEAQMIPDPSEDWKLNRNVECRIILNKLKIKTPEYETMEFCRMLTNRPVPTESTVSSTKDVDFKSKFLLDILLNEILGKCEEKCKVCEEYVQQLRHHIIQAHSGHPNPSPHTQTVTVFKCDVCSSIYSSPSMLIRHQNTHPNQSDTLTTPCTNESEPVQFDSNNISTSFVIFSLTTKTESVSSGQCEDHPHQPVPISPMNVEWNCFKQEELSSSQSQVEMSNPNPLGILQHMNNLSTIENNLKQESDDLECEEDLSDPLPLKDADFLTHENSSIDTPAGGESFIVPSDLISHKITHSIQKSHKCDICGKCFGKSQLLARHKLVHTGRRPHKCEVCGKCFTRNYHLTRHRLRHTGEKPFRCDECGSHFALKYSLALHKLTHSVGKQHNCDSCTQSFYQPSQLTQHKLKHTGEKTHKCDMCEKSFKQSGHLTRHKLTHTEEKSFHCDECGKDFPLKYSLAMHKLTHTGVRSHKCDVCEKSFIQSAHLTRHKRIHTEEKSFHCDECGQSFYRGYELSKHKLKHAWQSTTTTLVNHLKEERESEEEGCQEDPLLNLEVSS